MKPCGFFVSFHMIYLSTIVCFNLLVFDELELSFSKVIGRRELNISL